MGIKTNYGTYVGKMDILSSLSTLSFDKRRSKFFTDELLILLKLIDTNQIDYKTLYGSWAGAFGFFQFMPSTMKNHAIDYNKDNYIDLKNPYDAYASAANYLSNMGWEKNSHCFYKVELNNDIQAENSYFSKFVCLNSEGKIQAKLIGDVFKDLEVPVGKVISSPSCRARQTANLAFGKIDVIHNTLVHYFPWFEDDKDFFANVKKILKKYKPKNKENIIITGHNTVMGENVFDKIIPKNLKFRLQEGGFYVIKNDGNKLILVHKFESFFNFTGSLYTRPLDK